MADITMCNDAKCPLNMTCYRYQASPSNWQSYFMNSPKVENPNGTVECEHYWDMKKRK
jgi:hypothetical protein